MNIITTGAKYKITSTTKFDNLTFSDNGLILKYRKKQEIKISFSELDKIYIKSYKLNLLLEFLFIIFPFFLILLSIQYLQFDMVLFVALFTVIPVFVKVNNYKWYRLKICLKDGTFFTKKVSVNVKAKNISIINEVQKKCLYYNVNRMASA